jgi:Domain of unknown function (DUF397)
MPGGRRALRDSKNPHGPVLLFSANQWQAFTRGVKLTLETELASLDAAAPAGQDDDPTLLDELPNLGDIRTGAPPALTERLLDAFDVQAVYNRDKHQVTIHATITGASTA